MTREQVLILVVAEPGAWSEQLSEPLRTAGLTVRLATLETDRGRLSGNGLVLDGPDRRPVRASEFVALSRPVVLVLDMDFCGGAALELLEQLKQAGHAAPAVLLSSSERAALLERAWRAGARVVLHKPVAPASLLRAVLRLVRLARRAGATPALPPPSGNQMSLR